MQTLALIFVLVVIVEALVEYFLGIVPSAYKPYAAGVLGVLLCVAYGADLLTLLGLVSPVPYIGSVLTGLLISRGSNVFNDMISRLNVIRTPAAPVDQVER